MWRSRHLSVALTLTARGLAREGILDRIAALVAECPPGEGVLLEGTLDGAPLALIPSGARATESLCALADDAEGALVVGRPGLAPTPGRGCPEERWGALIGADTIEGVTDDDRRRSWDPDGADDLPRLGDLGNPSVWIAVKSHWVALPA